MSKIDITTNTKTSDELVVIYNSIINKWNLKCGSVQKNFLYTEDSVPFMEVIGNISTKKEAKNLVQELANEMNVRVLFNRLEISSYESTLYMSIDLNIEQFEDKNYTGIISRYGQDDPNYGDSVDAQEYLEDFGQVFLPKNKD